MAYAPNIADYKPFWIQSGTNAARDTATSWGMVAKTNPYPLLPTPKEPYKNDWKDESGDDEYNAVMHYEPIEFSVQFYIKTFKTPTKSAEQVLREQMDSFFDAVKNGEFKIYDAYTGIGRQKVRYAGYDEGSYKKKNDWARAIFTVKFKINDPITRMKLSGTDIIAI